MVRLNLSSIPGSGKPKILLTIIFFIIVESHDFGLEHSLEVGNLNYRRMMFSKASDVYSQALKRIGELSPDHNPIKHDDRVCDVCVDLLLSYSRCMRKMGKLVEGKSPS